MNRRNSNLSTLTLDWWLKLQPYHKMKYRDVVQPLFLHFPDKEHYNDAGPDRCRTCAVVGNSDNLIGSHYGQLIDSHDFIISTYTNVKRTIQANKDKVMIMSPEFMRYVYKNWSREHGRYPSTGFLTLVLALHICDQVNVFGFGARTDGRWYHYYDKVYRQTSAFTKNYVALAFIANYNQLQLQSSLLTTTTIVLAFTIGYSFSFHYRLQLQPSLLSITNLKLHSQLDIQAATGGLRTRNLHAAHATCTQRM
ncbi:CMP-N-acetylneuraminate-beta-galactosamide-alpha-2,3-sialyltransferase 1-like [Neoarius graeffei]|uniref:CMP-N-acetylneuraminate-beta-galactosamide- alpha-2,3-sialyltransferase 1-like n=1 Tax=Neoarius graeffei TaxID=443677 RepID=UPI00298CAB3D|nr:CMP-N-acetylneuraminate-beta-galactosamide-alpha-2,3-sialyltransferase 1-like [Neoarius graeffei]